MIKSFTYFLAEPRVPVKRKETEEEEEEMNPVGESTTRSSSAVHRTKTSKHKLEYTKS
jgi:hypothetical protein